MIDFNFHEQWWPFSWEWSTSQSVFTVCKPCFEVNKFCEYLQRFLSCWRDMSVSTSQLVLLTVKISTNLKFDWKYLVEHRWSLRYIWGALEYCYKIYSPIFQKNKTYCVSKSLHTHCTYKVERCGIC